MSEEATTVPHIDLALVDDCLERFFAVSSARAERYGRPSEELWRVLRKASMGGKRFRPRMVMTAYAGLGGTDAHAAATRRRGLRAPAHRARRARRRHRPRLVAPRAAERRRVATATTATTAGSAAADRRAPGHERRRDRRRPRALRGARASSRPPACDGDPARAPARTVRRGRVRQRRRRDDRRRPGSRRHADGGRGPGDGAGEDRASTRSRLRCSPAPCWPGADEAVVTALGAFGREIGIAYQIVDDLLGVFGDETDDRQDRAGRPARGQAHDAHRATRRRRTAGRTSRPTWATRT